MLIHPIDGINWKSLTTLVVIVGVTGFFFRNAPASKTVLMAAALVVVVICFMFAQMALVKASITDDSLVIGGGLYRVRVPLRDVHPSDAALSRSGGVPRLSWRTNGIGIPGLSLGWFRTSDGDKVFGAVTDPQRALRLPTSLGYDIVLSPRDPQRFLADLSRQRAAAERQPATAPPRAT